MKLIILSLLLSSTVFAGKLQDMQRELRNKENYIQKLTSEITDIEKNVGVTNIEYLDKVKKTDSLEDKIQEVEKSLEENALLVAKEFKLTKKAFNAFLIERLDNEYENEEIREKIYKKLLSKKIKGLKEIQKQNANLLGSLQMIETRLQEYKKVEEEIYNKIVLLENLKKEKGRKYISLLESKNRLQDSLDKIIVKIKTKQASKPVLLSVKEEKEKFSNFSLPLLEYTEISQDKKGLAFVYREVLPVQAPFAGMIVYAGELSNYGKVIMIDHGNSIRSVLLGDFSIKLKKGSKVSKGQVLAYTEPPRGQSKSLYYEVRKENKVQNASAWFKNIKIVKNKTNRI